MNKINILQIIITACSGIIAIYILIDLRLKKIKLKNKKEKINNNKYIILIFIIITLFFVYGILRNFK